MKHKSGENEHIVCYAIIFVLCIATMLISAFNNSPLTERIGPDGGIYLMMGRNMIQGGSLYRDLFDHKGPLIFVINAIPQLFIKGTVGVWILEVIFMLISAILLYKTGCRLIKNKSALIPPLIYIGVMGFTMVGGNYTEEYSNLFVIISLYIFVIWVEKKELSSRCAFVLGLCMAVVFFMRPNNIVIIAVIVAYIGIYSIVKDRKSVLRYILFGIIGLGAVTGIIVVYHYHDGTLYDMFNATLLHNLRYCAKGQTNADIFSLVYTPFKGWLVVINLIILYGIIRSLIYKDRQYAIFLGAGSVLSDISILISGRQFVYYIMLVVPMLSMAIMMILVHGTPDLKKYIKKEKKILRCGAILSVFIVVMELTSINVNDVRKSMSAYKNDCIMLCDNIPIDQRDDIFGYDVPAMWFYVNDVTPGYHYFTMQSWMSKTNPDIDENVLTYVMEEHPMWLVTYWEDAGNNFNLREIILSDYEEVADNSSGYLYKYKED